MRHLHLAGDLRLRFPRRGEEFDEGFEVGMFAAFMSLGTTEIRLRVSAASLEQISIVAAKLGYHLRQEVRDTEGVEATFTSVHARPQLRIVSRPEDVNSAATG